MVEYGLKKKAFQANFYEICVELKDPIVREACFLSKKACNSRSPCEFHSDWAKVRTNALGFLKRSRLKE
jgi:DNA-binding IscR family transcriptional regulator